MTVSCRVTPFLWFNTQAEEAARFYTSIIRDSQVTKVVPGPGGSVMVVEFSLGGTKLIAFNGGPQFRFTEAISLVVDCHSQAEVDEYWDKLGAGGEPSQCGWLKDRYGLSWQIVPSVLPQLMSDPDPARGQRVMGALMTMGKIDIATLERAAAGE